LQVVCTKHVLPEWQWLGKGSVLKFSTYLLSSANARNDSLTWQETPLLSWHVLGMSQFRVILAHRKALTQFKPPRQHHLVNDNVM